MLIGCGTGVAVGSGVNVSVGSNVEVRVAVSAGGLGVSVSSGAVSAAQPVSTSEITRNTNKVFFIFTPVV